MINAIIDAVSISINAEFGDAYRIYTESIEQGLKEPCFFIACLNPTKDLFFGKKYFRKNLFGIQHFQKGKEKAAECNGVLERLFDCLEYVSVQGDLIRGTKLHGEMVDGVLNFFVNYDMFIYKMEDKTPMEELKQTETDVKG